MQFTNLVNFRAMTLTEYMTKNRLTDAEVSRRLGRPIQTVNRWRRGLRIPRSRDDLAAIEKLTDGAVTVSDFFSKSPSEAA